jgi:hypothetical protein
MAIHDWSRVPAGLFHDFHQSWSIRIKDALNAGRLPKGFSALVEQRAGSREADVLTLERHGRTSPPEASETGSVLLRERPTTTIIRRTSDSIYAGRANRIVIRHHLGRVVAVIEILSPGNKDSRAAARDFVDKAVEFLHRGIHLLIVDLFPPTPRDPFGMHKLIWDEVHEEDFAFPAGKDRLLASYQVNAEIVAYVEPLAVGDALPDMALFLTRDLHIKVPLDMTYEAAWTASPEEMRSAVQTGVMPQSEEE